MNYPVENHLTFVDFLVQCLLMPSFYFQIISPCCLKTCFRFENERRAQKFPINILITLKTKSEVSFCTPVSMHRRVWMCHPVQWLLKAKLGNIGLNSSRRGKRKIIKGFSFHGQMLIASGRLLWIAFIRICPLGSVAHSSVENISPTANGDEGKYQTNFLAKGLLQLEKQCSTCTCFCQEGC